VQGVTAMPSGVFQVRLAAGSGSLVSFAAIFSHLSGSGTWNVFFSISTTSRRIPVSASTNQGPAKEEVGLFRGHLQPLVRQRNLVYFFFRLYQKSPDSGERQYKYRRLKRGAWFLSRPFSAIVRERNLVYREHALSERGSEIDRERERERERKRERERESERAREREGESERERASHRQPLVRQRDLLRGEGVSRPVCVCVSPSFFFITLKPRVE